MSAVAYEAPATGADYGRAAEERASLPGRTPLDVLGQLGGHLAWLWHDQTPPARTAHGR
ncbi:hypothetical protein [Kitasatospora sp. NPDC048407]|uniref:hypothetical protein n=1 Tax=Kitasatospora sp. NPDC048407 TaxID=3364051 RepID=UPI0037102399